MGEWESGRVGGGGWEIFGSRISISLQPKNEAPFFCPLLCDICCHPVNPDCADISSSLLWKAKDGSYIC